MNEDERKTLNQLETRVHTLERWTSKIDSRLWSLLLGIVLNLLTTLGGFFILLSQQ